MLGRPCKIVDMSTSKTGKHGHAKVHLVAIDVSILSVPDPSLSHNPARSSPARNWYVFGNSPHLIILDVRVYLNWKS